MSPSPFPLRDNAVSFEPLGTTKTTARNTKTQQLPPNGGEKTVEVLKLKLASASDAAIAVAATPNLSANYVLLVEKYAQSRERKGQHNPTNTEIYIRDLKKVSIKLVRQ